MAVHLHPPLWHGAELCIRSTLPDFLGKKLACKAVNDSINIMEEDNLNESEFKNPDK
jgi:hypothetical protein